MALAPPLVLEQEQPPLQALVQPLARLEAQQGWQLPLSWQQGLGLAQVQELALLRLAAHCWYSQSPLAALGRWFPLLVQLVRLGQGPMVLRLVPLPVVLRLVSLPVALRLV